MSEEHATPDDMRRRSFLRVGTLAAGSAAGAGSSGCSALLMNAIVNNLDPEAISAFLANLDQGLDEIDERPVIHRALEAIRGMETVDDASPRVRARLERAERLGRRILRAMLVAGAYHDLPQEARETAQVLEHLGQLGPEMDETLIEAAQLVASCPQPVRTSVRELLQDDPEVAMRFGELLDGRSGTVGMGRGGRTKLRQTCTYLTGRLSRQPPNLLIDDCLDRIERTVANRGIDVDLWRQVTADGPCHELWDEGVEDPFDVETRRAKGPEEGASPEPAPPEAESTVEQASSWASQASQDELAQGLQDVDVQRRVAAIREIGNRQIVAAVPALRRTLRTDASPEARGWTLRALAEINTPAAQSAIEECHEDHNPRVRTLALQLRPPAQPVASDPTTDQAPTYRPATPVNHARDVEPQRNETRSERRQRRRRIHRNSAIILGTSLGTQLTGLLVLGIGAVTAEGAMTAGTILMGLAFVVLIIGLAIYFRERRRSQTARAERPPTRQRSESGYRVVRPVLQE